MKKTIKGVTASLTAMLMMFGSTYTAVGSVSATNSEVQPRSYHVYGDVNDDGNINISDAVNIAQFITVYKNKHNISCALLLKDALDYLHEDNNDYYLPVPQAADLDGDGFITEADYICIQNYEAKNYDRIGRCGQLFYINE
ncbi:MAG: dockerin type I repeat-containing protein [Ruminococcus flavefaciens]|nr:dockerin type I repeat-containing protein [Ruminococcus flavefaciens]